MPVHANCQDKLLRGWSGDYNEHGLQLSIKTQIKDY